MTTATTTSSSRIDNRAIDEMRPIQIIRGVVSHAPGSVLVCFGNTKVLVTASIDDRVPRHIYVGGQNQPGWLTAEYSLLPGSTHTRANRDRFKVSGRTMEIQRLIGRSLRGAIDLSGLGQRTITIDADVLQADGGTRVASITGGYVALVDAVNYLMENELIKERPTLNPIASVSVGMVNGAPVLDLNYDEDVLASVDANVVMNDNGEFIEFQATAESSPFSRDNLDAMAKLAEKGIGELLQAQQAALASPITGAGLETALPATGA